jgi:hypothetical protein
VCKKKTRSRFELDIILMSKTIKGITKVFAELGIPKQAVEVIIHEIPKTHWGIGGTPASQAMPHDMPS